MAFILMRVYSWWAHSFSTGPIVVHAGLVIKWGEDGEPLSKFDLVALLEGVEVPANKRIIIRICISGDE